MTKRKRILKYFKNIFLIALFSVFSIFGMSNLYDVYKLLFLQLSNNIKFLFRFGAIFKLLTFIVYFYLYSFLIIFSIIHKLKLKRLHKLQAKEDVQYLKIQDNDSLAYNKFESDINTHYSESGLNENSENNTTTDNINKKFSDAIHMPMQIPDNTGIINEDIPHQNQKPDTENNQKMLDSPNQGIEAEISFKEKLNDENKNDQSYDPILLKLSGKNTNFIKKEKFALSTSFNSSNKKIIANKKTETNEKNQRDEEMNKINSCYGSNADEGETGSI